MSKKIFQGLRRKLGNQRASKFDFLIFFVTGQCNARCRHCFYWQNLGADHKGLVLPEIKQLAKSMPAFRTLLLSGGEPSLRDDLAQIINTFREYNGIKTVDIPTNGLLPKKIFDLAQDILTTNSTLQQVSFNLSIDGFADTHDRIRGIPGSFERALDTASRLRDLKSKFNNLRIVVNTVICADNCNEIVDFAHHIHDQGLFDNHFFEIVRGVSPEEQIQHVSPDTLKEIYSGVLPIQENYLRQNKWSKYRLPISLWRRVADIGQMVYQYRTQWRAHALHSKWDIPCMAGETINTVDYNGDVRICELRSAAINLKDTDFDFNKALDSSLIQSEREIAKLHQCDCTHVCFLMSSLYHNPRARLQKVPYLYLRYKLLGKWL